MKNSLLKISFTAMLLLSFLAPLARAGLDLPAPPYDIQCTATKSGSAYAIKLTISSTTNGIHTVQSAPAIKINDGCRGEIMIGTEEPVPPNPNAPIVTVTPQSQPTPPPPQKLTRPANTLFTGLNITVVKPTSTNEILYIATALSKNAIIWAHTDTIKITPEGAP